MGINNAKDGKLLYHLTQLDNLKSIIQYGLVSRRFLREATVDFVDVANQEIIDRRGIFGLDSYTPFHFHPYSAFDVAVKNTHSDKDFIYICINRIFARKNGFKILPMHPLSISDNFELLDYDLGMKQIDWETLIEKGRIDEYAKKVKMAECLTNPKITPDCFQQIAVRNEIVKQKVELLFRYNHINYPPPYINIHSEWLNVDLG